MAGIGINKNRAHEEMLLAKILSNQTGGRQYKHFIFSFDDDIALSNDDIMKIGYEIGSYYANEYQISMAVHLDTNNTHIHYVLNSVNIYTGTKFRQSRGDLFNYKLYVNDILKNYNLSPITMYIYEDETDDLDNIIESTNE